MCGIAGALLNANRDAIAPVRRMSKWMVRRGPDAEGEWSDPAAGIAFGHRRLSIIDLDARANQPFASTDGRHVIVFNGEIYNYQALRQELIGAGVALRTTSDTEVILELFRREGAEAFRRLRGMFALGIWDAVERRLVLARDPYGIKPLYVGQARGGVVFASQVKAILASGLVSTSPDNAGVVGFFQWGSIPEPFTLYKDIRAVPAGCHLTVTADGISASRAFADLASAWVQPVASVADVAEEVREAVRDSVAAHLVSDVPVAILLSGGIDSGAVAGLVSELGHPLEAITIRFNEFAGTSADESAPARLMAAHYRLKHTERLVTRDEFLTDVPAILAAMDQPSIDGVNTWFASRAVAECGYKVVLSGVGGDELLCGYDSFDNIPRMMALGRGLASTGLIGAANPLFAGAARLLRRPKLQWLPRYVGDFESAYVLRRSVLVPEELRQLLPDEAVAEGLAALAAAAPSSLDPSGDPQAKVSLLESTHYLRNQLLRDSDWASMAHSLELRTPLTDWTLLRRLAPHSRALGHGKGKRMLAAAPRRPLPESIVSRRKTGFGLPMGAWLRELAPGTGGAQAPWARVWSRVVATSFGLDAELKKSA
jgi:asparagine synthase (glutamine-hydrolysing)